MQTQASADAELVIEILNSDMFSLGMVLLGMVLVGDFPEGPKGTPEKSPDFTDSSPIKSFTDQVFPLERAKAETRRLRLIWNRKNI